MADLHRDEIAKLEALFAANPDGRIFTHLAEAYRKAGDLARARETVEAGLERHAEYPSAHVVLGRVLGDLGETEGAEQAFRRVLELDPENRVALRGLGDLARGGGRPGDALKHYRALLLLDPSDEEVEGLAREVEAQAVEAGESEFAAEAAWEAGEEPAARAEASAPPEASAADVAGTAAAGPDGDPVGIMAFDIDEAGMDLTVPEEEPDGADTGRAGAGAAGPAAGTAAPATGATPAEAGATRPAGGAGGPGSGAAAPGAGGVSSGAPGAGVEGRTVGPPSKEIVEGRAAAPAEPAVGGAVGGVGGIGGRAAERSSEASGDEGDYEAPVVTETMADLYARQGLHEKAAEVYRELLRGRAGDERLEAKLREAQLRVEEAASVEAGPERPSEGARSSPATAGAESGPGEPAGPEALGGLVLSGLDADAEAAIAEEVEPLAGMEPLHDLEAEAPVAGVADAADDEDWDVPTELPMLEDATAGSVEPGAPSARPGTQPTIGEYLRALLVFRASSAAPAAGGRPGAATPADAAGAAASTGFLVLDESAIVADDAAAGDEFDELFGDAPTARPDAAAPGGEGGEETGRDVAGPGGRAAGGGDGGDDEDLEMFRAWLQNLKR